MGQVARTLAEPGDLETTLRRITATARDTVPGCDYCSLSIRREDDTLETWAATDPLILELDQLQYILREGPCYNAIEDGPVQVSPDVRHDPRWPKFGREASDRGIGSQMAVRVSEQVGSVTGLNLYARELDAFEPSDSLATLFASHAAIALGYVQELTSLTSALQTREDIGKAIGILMERYQLSDERAFEFLVRLSNDSNTKLRDVAARVVEDRRASVAH